jgi:hypothetical protein
MDTIEGFLFWDLDLDFNIGFVFFTTYIYSASSDKAGIFHVHTLPWEGVLHGKTYKSTQTHYVRNKTT